MALAGYVKSDVHLCRGLLLKVPVDQCVQLTFDADWLRFPTRRSRRQRADRTELTGLGLHAQGGLTTVTRTEGVEDDACHQ
jgi:hypothetical protein